MKSATSTDEVSTRIPGFVERITTAPQVNASLRIMASHVVLSELLAIAIFVAGVSGWTLAISGSINILVPLFSATLFVSLVGWGRVALVAFGVQRLVDRALPLAIVTGAVLLSFCIAAIRLIAPWSLTIIYAAQALLGAGAYLLLASRIANWRPAPRGQWVDFGIILFSLLAATFWSSHLMPLAEPLGEQTFYRPFIEFFFHTTHTTPLLIDGTPVQLGSFQFAGVPLAYYHYGSYALPALFAELTGRPAYESLVGFWFPMGVFLTGVASYVLGASLFTRYAGFWGVVAVLAIPDPSWWGSPVVFYSFDAFLEGSPALTYATSAAVLATVLMTLGVRHRRLHLTAVAFAVAATTVFFKANVLVAAMPFCGLYFVASLRRFPRPVALGALAVLAGLALLGLWAGTRLRSAPTIGFDANCGRQFAEFLLTENVPASSNLQRLAPFVQAESLAVAIPARLFFILAVTFQYSLAIVAAVFVVTVGLSGWRMPHTLLCFVLAIYLGSAVFLPPNQNGDPYELQHRAFFWAYIFTAVWVAGMTVRLCNQVFIRRFGREYAAGFALLCFPLVLGRETVIEPRDPVPTGLVNSARYVLTHGPSTDIVQDAKNDPHLIVAALSQRRSYICISLEDTFPGSGALRTIHTGRAAECQALLQAKTRDELASFAQRTGVRWFVLHPDSQVAWPRDIYGAPVFQDRGFRVYDLAAIAGGEAF